MDIVLLDGNFLESLTLSAAVQALINVIVAPKTSRPDPRQHFTKYFRQVASP
jgi:hypothetical protein